MLIVLVVLGLLGALLVAGMWRWMRVATDEEEAVVQQYVDAVNSGRFEAARKLMLHPERESKAAFERAAHQQVFRRTRQIAFVGFDKVTIDDDSTTCLNVEADRELFHFELVGRGGNWKIRVAAQPGVCAGTWVRGTAPGDRP